MAQVETSIVIVTYNSAGLIAPCLESVGRCTPEPHEVIVVDNASRDGTAQVLAGTDGITAILNEENEGFARASNQGIEASRGRRIVLLNPDTVVTPGWTRALSAQLTDRVGAVGPLSNYVAGLQQVGLHAGGLPTDGDIEELAAQLAARNRGRSVETPILVGFCLMMRRDLVERLGALDEDLFLGNEDFEYSWRLRREGYTLLVATDAFVFHHGQQSFASAGLSPSSPLVAESLDILFVKIEEFFRGRPVPPARALFGADWLVPSDGPGRDRSIRSLVVRHWKRRRFDDAMRWLTRLAARDEALAIETAGELHASGEHPDPEALFRRWLPHLAPGELSRPRDTGPLRVVLQGEFRTGGSLGVVNLELAEHLSRREGIDLRLSLPLHEKDDPVLSPMRYDPRDEKWRPQFTIRHHWPPSFDRPMEGRLVVMQPWEFGSLPREWVRLANENADDCWAYTDFVRQTYVKSGVGPSRVHTVPLGVNPGLFNPGAAPMELPTKKRFRFLYLGGTVARKGIEELLDAYLGEFSTDDDVCLVVKGMGAASHYRRSHEGERIRRLAEDPALPEILYMEDDLPREALPGLYRACSALAAPYRGEGFGLPIAEAMACGLPVIITAFGAALDFCSEENAYLVPYSIAYFPENRVEEIETVEKPFLAYADLPALRKTMRHLLEHPSQGAARGALASRHILERFTWERTAAAMGERLRQLAGRPADTAGSISRLYESAVGALKLGSLKEARRLFVQVLAIDERHAPSLNNLGVIYMQTKNLGLAQDHFRRALAADPGLDEARLNLARLAIHDGSCDEAMRSLELLLRLNPSDGTIVRLAAACLMKAGRDEALRALLDGAPKSPGLYSDVAAMWKEEGREDRALETMREGLRLFPGNPGLSHQAGLALMGKEEYAEALLHLGAYLAAFPRDEEIGKIVQMLALLTGTK